MLILRNVLHLPPSARLPLVLSLVQKSLVNPEPEEKSDSGDDSEDNECLARMAEARLRCRPGNPLGQNAQNPDRFLNISSHIAYRPDWNTHAKPPYASLFWVGRIMDRDTVNKTVTVRLYNTSFRYAKHGKAGFSTTATWRIYTGVGDREDVVSVKQVIDVFALTEHGRVPANSRKRIMSKIEHPAEWTDVETDGDDRQHASIMPEIVGEDIDLDLSGGLVVAPSISEATVRAPVSMDKSSSPSEISESDGHSKHMGRLPDDVHESSSGKGDRFVFGERKSEKATRTGKDDRRKRYMRESAQWKRDRNSRGLSATSKRVRKPATSKGKPKKNKKKKRLRSAPVSCESDG